MCTKKKVIFCSYSSIYSSIVLEQLLADRDIKLVGIVNSTRVLRPSLNSLQGAITQIKTSGLRYSTYLFLITDLFKWIQPLLTIYKRPFLRPIHALAKLNHITIIDTKDINKDEIVDFISKKKPDFLLCGHFNQLLKAPVLSISEMQCINIHPSLLPSYKGVDPVFFAMRDNVDEIGVTIHKMDETFDTGEILSQAVIKVDKPNSLIINNSRLFREGIKLAINWMKNGNTSVNTNNPSNNLSIKASINNNNEYQNYDSWPSSECVKDFKKSGKKLVKLTDLWNHQ